MNAPHRLWDPTKNAPPPPEGATCGQCPWSQLAGPGPKVLRCMRHGQARVQPGEAACPAFEAPPRCEDCGACCRQAFHVVEIGPRDPFLRSLPDWWQEGYLRRVEGRIEMPRLSDGKCPALDREGADHRCRCYAVRPRTCRDFGLGTANCLEARRRVGRSR